MKLLVTGGAGFIGSNFIHYWLKKYPDDKIINLDALTYAGNVDNLKNLPNKENYQFVLGNICDPQMVNEVMQEVDLVVHFAAESHVDNSIIDSTPFVRTNVLGTQVLLDAALKQGKKRFHHISTDEVFGSLGPNEPPFNEHTPYDPRSPYSASKAGADHLVRAYWHTHNLPITISNCSNNYGPRQHREKLIPLFITNLLQNKPVPLYGTGQNIRDWLYVEDHCRAIDFIIKKGKIGETYLIGGKGNKEKEVTNLELAKKLINLLGKDASLIEYAEDRKGHDFRYAIDDSKLRSELGWQPQVNFAEGLNKTIEWHKI
ncbi:dTDP-glucose 4,6-dehydratase [Candidatus Falkowbacteria bacterium RIFCSPLOWO2_02_FULL_45_15]|uniref:dTDP-glucose 4,6-dehydratase n=2 Tax=Candidatus Falkowiibacteriota TaxID=1752728 RepID=A0A1F5RL03_9BACT|nr:MAG: dTDP-glucose 4,6-dehydratase [Candidatus Falkowbacteria bacterium RIFCSPHIGHO2_02_FULL_45_15]OGF19092.1 MAG: dTDP-glucose 4,6-dehydratase [Candidatus Falkowbacteria bacterium RIFCSPLOWO2_02_FULL_45_15]